jgi:hypothetical protein
MGNTPDAFFPYRVSQIPYLVLNEKGVQCTNSIHRIYFKNMSGTEKKWIQISLLSVPGQLSIESNSKVYGSGLLKVEPGSLKKAIAVKNKSKVIDSIYDKISKLLSLQKRSNAMDLATDFIDAELNISSDLSDTAKSLLKELQDRRLSKRRQDG